MSKVSVGVISVFNHETQDWSLYKGRLEQWFLANEINENVDKSGAKRRAILLSSLAENTYRLVRDLALPNDVGTLTFTEVTSLLDGHFKIKKCGFAERHKFHCAVQEAGETLQQWAARVRGLALDCGFTDSVRKEHLRDRFVLGMANGPERDRLYGETMDELTLEKALQLAESVRCAREGARQATHGQQVSQVMDVHKVSPRAGPSSAPARGQAAGSASQHNYAPAVKCDVCGYSGHSSSGCRFKNYSCRQCGDKGHLKRMCKKNVSNQHFLQYCADEAGDDGKQTFLFNIRSVNGEPLKETVFVDSTQLSFELDTGSAITAISDRTYMSLFANYPLRESSNALQSYDGSVIKTVGIISLPFTYKNKKKNIDVYVVKGGGPPLLGRDFMTKFNLQISQINSCELVFEESNLVQKYPKLFSEQLGCCKGVQVKLNLKPGSVPIFIKARPVPFALKPKLEEELNRLQTLGIIEPVMHAEYASPVVPVLKHDGTIRLCADYSATLNKQLLIEKYPLPRIDELFSRLHGGVQFTKLDLSSAYNQLQLDTDSQMLSCINTHKGLYKYNRLVFGLSSAPAIFQRTLENILSGIDGVLQFLDDILITGRTKKEHLSRLHQVFQRLESAGLVLRKDKCSFFQDSVSYLGFIVDKNGLHKSPDKIKAILEAERPRNVSELKSFLGLVNYYRSFVVNASSILYPLHALLKKNQAWLWEKEQENAFNLIKKELYSEKILAHFNPEAKIILTVDASPYGLGAILSQVEHDVEKPIAYASRSLTSAEKQYSQIQKEATAIVFGIRKFHQYLYGRADPFILRTDHKPLLSIFRPSKGVPEVSANRLQRYALFLTAYNYVIEYVSSAHNTADYLSRALPPAPGTHDSPGIDNVNNSEASASTECQPDSATYLHFIWKEGPPPVSVSDVRTATESDSVLSQLLKYLLNGWPDKNKISTELRPFYECRLELAVEQGCLMRGDRLVVPESLRQRVMNELHRGHLGIMKMKADARSRFWWPAMLASLERAAAACEVCAQLRPAPPRAPLTPWPFPPEPWFRVHLDLLGPIHSKVFLVAVDAYSKWVEVFDVSSGYATKTIIEKLCELMSRYGLINTICTDNGTSFVSQEFEMFCSRNGITHLTSPTYHPASNGQAESYVKIIKRAIKSSLLSGTHMKDMNTKLNEFLFSYRNSVHSTTNRSPAQVLFGRNLRCRLDLMNPIKPPSSDTAIAEVVKEKQFSQVKFYRGRRNIDFSVDNIVLIKVNDNQNSLWLKGQIVKRLGRSAYLVKIIDQDRIVKRHKNQIYEFKGEEVLAELELTQHDRERTTDLAGCSSDADEIPQFVLPVSVPEAGEFYDPADGENEAVDEVLTPPPPETGSASDQLRNDTVEESGELSSDDDPNDVPQRPVEADESPANDEEEQPRRVLRPRPWW